LSSTPYRPDSATHPLSVYGESKLQGEAAVLRALPDRSVVLRTAWVYAAEGRNFVRTMLRLMAANGTVRVVSDQVGSPTSARSLAEIIWRIAECPELRGIHHWTNAGVASWYDFAVAIAEEAAGLGLLPSGVEVKPITTVEYPTPARRPPYSVLDRSSLRSVAVDPVHWRQALRSVLRELHHV
jgi:dTDP-4-dehydrorhamnose reductase